MNTLETSPTASIDLSLASVQSSRWFSDFWSELEDEQNFFQMREKFLKVKEIMICGDGGVENEEEIVAWRRLISGNWWIEESKGWFQVGLGCFDVQEWMALAFPAMVLEVWYRFVWARYCLRVFGELGEVPRRVRLFMDVVEVCKVIDEVEGEFFESGVWDIRICVDKLIEIIEKKDVDSQFTNDYIVSVIENRYEHDTLPFLQKCGITTDPDDKWQWSWNSNFDLEFVDEVMIPMFRNLTSEGDTSFSDTILNSYPNLYLLSESRTMSNLSNVCYEMEEDLKASGILTDPIEEVLALLDQLVEEKKLLNKSIDALEHTTARTNTEDYKHRIYISKLERLEAVEIQIEQLRDELHALTESQDVFSEGDLDCTIEDAVNIDDVISIFERPTF